MISLTKSIITLATLAFALSAPLANAQDGAAPDHAKPRKEQRGGGERITPTERADRMAKHLGLTDVQKQSVLAILQSEETLGKALHDDKALSKYDRRAKMEAIRKDGREKIAALLTPEQQAKFAQAPGPKHGPEGKHGPDAK